MRRWAAAGLALALSGCAGAHATQTFDQCLLVAQEDGASLAQYRLSTGEQRVHPVGQMPHEIEVSADGRMAYVSQFGMRDFSHETGSAGDRIVEIDLHNGAARAFILPEGLRAPHGVLLRPGGRELFTNTEVGVEAMVVFDVETGAVLRHFPIPARIHHFTFPRGGAVFYAFANQDGVYKIDAQTGAVLAHVVTETPARSVTMVENDSLVMVAARGAILFLDADDLSLVRSAPVSGVAQVIYASRDEASGLMFAPAPGENVVVALDYATGAERARIAFGRTPTHAIPDGRGHAFIPNVAEDFVTEVDLESFETTPIGPFQRPNGLALGNCWDR